jgi:integrase
MIQLIAQVTWPTRAVHIQLVNNEPSDCKLAASHRRVILVNVSTIFSAAVDDEMIAKNPCRARSVAKPKVPMKKVVPWPLEQVLAVRDSLVARYRIVDALSAGLGLRQGEIFGLSPDDVDWLRGHVDVQRQVKLFANGKQAFALPKGGKTRTVPLPDKVRAELAPTSQRPRPGRSSCPGGPRSCGVHTRQYTLTTDTNGRYALWLDERESPLQLTAGGDGWVPKVATVPVRPGRATVQDMTVARLVC